MRVRTIALIVILALGLLAAPLPAEAQEAGKVYRIGLLASRFAGSPLYGLNTYLPRLTELGYVEGENVRFEARSPVESDEGFPELAADLVRLKVDIIVAAGRRAIRAAKQATTTIPIVMIANSDPVRAGLVASMARPGGNITGLTVLLPELSGKRLELLKETVPGLTRVGVFWDPANPDMAEEWRAAQAAAQVSGVELQSLEVRSRDDFEPAFDAAIRKRAGALIVLGGLLTAGLAPITDFARKSRLPVMYPHRRFVDPFLGYGGLMSYGSDPTELARRAASYVDKILKGTNPADLPVEQPMKFELWINLKTAKTLGLTIPDSLLLQADRVIR